MVRKVVARVSGLEVIISGVAKAYRLREKELREQRGRYQEAKGVAMTLAWDLCGMTLRELGVEFGGLDYAAAAQQVSRTRVRDREKRLKINLSKLRRDLSRIET